MASSTTTTIKSKQQLGSWKEDHKTKAMMGEFVAIRRLGWWWPKAWKKNHKKNSMVRSVTTIRRLGWRQQKDEKNIKRQRQW
jgi:hypothetical protein